MIHLFMFLLPASYLHAENLYLRQFYENINISFLTDAKYRLNFIDLISFL